MLGNEPVRFGGRPHGKGPAQQAPRRAADPAVKVNGVWRWVYRAVDQYGRVIDVLLSARRDAAARMGGPQALPAGGTCFVMFYPGELPGYGQVGGRVGRVSMSPLRTRSELFIRFGTGTEVIPGG